MKKHRILVVVVALTAAATLAAPSLMAQEPETLTAQGQEVEVPVPTEPGIFTMKGEFARIAYNNEGWVTMGYRTANDSQGQEWMLLEAGVTIFQPPKGQTLTRKSFSVTLPDGTRVPMATVEEYRGAGSLRALNARGDTVRDSINYFPISARKAYAMRFFNDPANRAQPVAFDQFDVNPTLACLGRLFFKMPEGQEIAPGQYWLNVQFSQSEVQAPFRIMTEEEEKFLRKNWKDLKKQHEAYLKAEAEKAKQQ